MILILTFKQLFYQTTWQVYQYPYVSRQQAGDIDQNVYWKNEKDQLCFPENNVFLNTGKKLQNEFCGNVKM